MSQEDMMDYANKEFKLRFDSRGNPHFEYFDGTPVDYLFDYQLWKQLNEKYERKAFLYVGKGYRQYTNLWKIGGSEDFVRRQGEVYAETQFHIQCAKKRAWKIERFFLKRYHQYREIGEYFRLPEEVVHEIGDLFTNTFTSEEALLEWIRDTDYRQWVKIIQS